MENEKRTDNKIIRVRRELQCEGAITKYYKDTVVLPDGKTEIYDFVGHNGAAAAVGVLPDGRLVMVRQYRNALDRFTLEIPAGGLNPESRRSMRRRGSSRRRPATGAAGSRSCSRYARQWHSAMRKLTSILRQGL